MKISVYRAMEGRRQLRTWLFYSDISLPPILMGVGGRERDSELGYTIPS
ncbi:hypothetical protein ACFL6S_22415 [Candidatus Poribacteria bacterium]